jgi:hypothetical protein
MAGDLNRRRQVIEGEVIRPGDHANDHARKVRNGERARSDDARGSRSDRREEREREREYDELPHDVKRIWPKGTKRTLPSLRSRYE